eukprot:1831869-Prymnesium_polylepis.1
MLLWVTCGHAAASRSQREVSASLTPMRSTIARGGLGPLRKARGRRVHLRDPGDGGGGMGLEGLGNKGGAPWPRGA